MKISFCFHDHQPVGNFPHVMEDAYQRCYLPMLKVLREHSGIRSGIHISGTLMEWLEREHPDYIQSCAELCSGGSMEFLTSGRYEPILPVFRVDDMVEQIVSFTGHLNSLTGKRPRGLWLTERVWEPQLPSMLARAGVEWCVVDDIHLKRAGCREGDLFRPCITEDSGSSVVLLGSNRSLRYMIPFREVGEVMARLREMHDSGFKMVFYGDDGEKFGLWPGTHDLCYSRGWLSRFFRAVEEAPWLETVLPSEAAGMDAAGPFYVPASSYPEMGEWTLHGSARTERDSCFRAASKEEDVEEADIYVTGGFWRNFLSYYAESRELRGRILQAEDTVRDCQDSGALNHFWRSQCNCAFWHGVFGGIYLPHLREALWKEITRAEDIALNILGQYPRIRRTDLDADGETEILVQTRNFHLLLRRGIRVSELTFLHQDREPVPLGHVLTRRPEAYHGSIPAGGGENGVRTIHDPMGSKEEGLARELVTDRFRRISFTDIIIDPGGDFQGWAGAGELIDVPELKEESSRELNGRLVVTGGGGDHGPVLKKELVIDLHRPCISALGVYRGSSGSRAGMEICLNLMTGDSPDRVFRIDDGEFMKMSRRGEFTGCRLEIVDSWRGVRVSLQLKNAADIWAAPLNSVNMSEGGYERVHQGTAFYISRMLRNGEEMELELTMELEALK